PSPRALVPGQSSPAAARTNSRRPSGNTSCWSWLLRRLALLPPVVLSRPPCTLLPTGRSPHVEPPPVSWDGPRRSTADTRQGLPRRRALWRPLERVGD